MNTITNNTIAYYIPSETDIENELEAMLNSRETKAAIEEGSVVACDEPRNKPKISSTKACFLDKKYGRILPIEPKEKASCVGAKAMDNKPTHTPVFAEENLKHEAIIPAVVEFFKAEGCEVKVLEGKNDQGCDLKIRRRGVVHKVEVKTNAGKSKNCVYNTFILESHVDHAKTILPEWRTNADYLVMVNLANNTIYLYNAKTLASFFDKAEASNVPHTKTGKAEKTKEAKCGWGYRINWACKEAGYIKSSSF